LLLYADKICSLQVNCDYMWKDDQVSFCSSVDPVPLGHRVEYCLMSAEWKKRDPATQCCQMRKRPVLTCGSCGICCVTAAKVSSAALEERAQDRLQAQGRVDFALFNIPRIAKS
jgi:hypothetical protein